MANLHVNLAFSADTGKAKAQIQELQTLLSKIAYTGTASNNLTGTMQKDIQAASMAAKDLQFHLNNAFNTTTGKFDLSLLDRSLKTSGANITDLSTKLLGAGATGQQAFMKLAQSISLADQPMFRISNRMKEFAVTMKNTVKWQLSSSMLHGFMGAIQSAYGYAQDLNKSLTNIRIVTGYSADQMAVFAEQANKAAKSLSTTTTDYTNASLIYFQQGLSDAEVAARTEVTVKMANAAGQTAQIVSDQMTAVWNNFYDGSKSLEYYADVMTALGAATATSTDEIAQGLSKFAAVADTVGLSYEFATAALATITSNTRESADVVGNALKTLFSRIQGLQLGETLEDGVDLNKYSEALAKIGVDVIDANGNLIAMDEILTNMASKWDGLTDSQKVATAETVAGVRQYTQLMALMENWDIGDADSFMANLKTIDNAEGTLQKQADIYAESWEAAEKRAKAAAEGIFQDLLDDKFFISLTDTFTNLLTGLDAFISGMGGVKTVLLGIGSIAMTIFANKLPTAIQTLKYNLSILTKGTEAAYAKIQADMQKATMQAFAKGGIKEDSAMGYAIIQANQLTEAKNRLAKVSDQMTEKARQEAQTTLALTEAFQAEAIALKQRNEQLRNGVQENLNYMSSPDNDYGYQQGKIAQKAMMSAYQGTSFGIDPEDLNGLEEAAITAANQIRSQLLPQLEAVDAKTKGLSESEKLLFNLFQNSNTFTTGFDGYIKPMEKLQEQIDIAREKLSNLSKGTPEYAETEKQIAQLGERFQELKGQASGFINTLPEGVRELKSIRQAINDVSGSKDITSLIKNWDKLKKQLSEIKVEGKNLGDVLKGSLDGKIIDKLVPSMRQLHTNTKETTAATERLQQLYNGFNPKAMVGGVQALSSAAAGLGNVAVIINQLKSLGDALTNPDLTGWEQLSTILMSISFLVPQTIALFNSMGQVQNWLTGIITKQAVAVTASAAANELAAQQSKKEAVSKSILAVINNTVASSQKRLTKEEWAALLAKEANMSKDKAMMILEAAKIAQKNGSIAKNAAYIASLFGEAAAKEVVVGKTKLEVFWQTILNALTGKWGTLIVAAIGVGIVALVKWIAGMESAAEQQQKAIDATKKSIDAYNEQQDKVDSLKNELETLGNTIDELQSKGPLSLVEEEELARARQQEALLKQELAYEEAILATKQKQAIYDWQQNKDKFDNWTDKVGNYDYKVREVMWSESTGEDDESIPYLGGENTVLIANEADLQAWFSQYEDFVRHSEQNKYTDNKGNFDEATFASDMAELYQHYLGEMLAAQQEQRQFILDNSESYKTDLEGYQTWYNSLTEEEKKNPANQAVMESSQQRLTKQGIIIYGSEEAYYSAMDKSFQNSDGYLQATNHLLQNLDNGIKINELINQFDTEFIDLLNSMGVNAENYAQYLINQYQRYGDALAKAQKPNEINLETLTSHSEWKTEYLDLLDDIAIGAGDTIESIIAKLKAVYENLPENQFSLGAWKKNYSSKMDIVKDLQAGDSITAEQYAALGEQYAHYFDVQTDGTAILIAKAEDLRSAVQSIETEELLNEIQDTQAQRGNAIVNLADRRKISTDEAESLLDNTANNWNNAALEGKLTENAALYYTSSDMYKFMEAALGDSINLSQYDTAVEKVAALSAAWVEASNNLNQNQQALAQTATSFDDLNNLLNEGTIDIDEYNAALDGVIAKEAKANDLDYEGILDYAKYLQENAEALEDVDDALKDNAQDAKKVATAHAKLNKAVKTLSDNWDEWNKAIKSGNMGEIQEYLPDINESLKDMLDLTDETFANLSDDFAIKNWDLIKDVVNGVKGSLEKLQVAAAEDMILNIKPELDGTDTYNQMSTLLNDLSNQAVGANLKIEPQVDNANALDAFVQLCESAGMTATQIASILQGIGWEPKIEYEELDVDAYADQESFGYQQVAVLNPDGSYRTETVDLAGAQRLAQDGKVYVPKIVSATKTGGGSGSYTPQKTGGGGGGGGSKPPKHAEKKNDSDKTRYHTLQNQLEDLTAEYDALADASDRAFGQEKLDNIDKEIQKTDELIAKQEEYLNAISTDLPIDKSVMSAYYSDLIGGKIRFDEKGNISNYDEIQDAMFAKYNEMTERFDQDSEEWQVFEKKYEQLEKYIEQYEETYDLLRDEEQTYQDLLNQRIDLELEKVTYSIEIALDIPESQIKLLEYQLGRIEDDAFNSGESVALLTKQAEQLYDQIQINKQGLNDALELSLSTSEIISLMAGDTSVLNGKTFTEDQIDAIKEYRDNLLDLNEEFDEIRETIEEKVMEVFDAWGEQLENSIEQLEHYGDVLESYRNIIDIVGEDGLGISDEFMKNLNEAQIGNAIDKVNATRDAYEAMMKAQQEAEKALEEAKVRGDEASIKMWTENLAELTDEANSAQEEFLSAWEDALDTVAEQFEMTVERVIESFNESIYALGGLEGLSEEFSRQQETADMMVDDYQKIYELSKLNRDIQKTLDDTNVIAGKQKLLKLQEKINDLEAEGVKMSQYDLEYLQAEYELRMAEIELENAQKAKDTVRMSRDNEGNWSYVYTTNTDAVDEAQQKYEDALYAMQDLSSNYIDEMSEKLISTSQEMEEALASLRIQDFASIDDYYAEVERIKKEYGEQLALEQVELQKAIDNNKILYDEDMTNYAKATGEKYRLAEEFVTSFKDSLLGSIMDSESESANFTDIIGSAVDDLTTGLMEAATTYYQNLEAAMNAADTSTGDFAEDTAANIDAVVEKSKEGAEAIDQMAIEMTEAFQEITDMVINWQETYGTAMEKIIQSNLDVIESFNQMLEALSIDADKINVSYDINTAPEKDNPAAFDTGGYTGKWGDIGKLAVLHEKELILNENDTSNFLKAINISKVILDMIEANAKYASMGLGQITPTVVKEETQEVLEQMVHITAEFPGVQDRNEIEEAFKTLINTSSQYANRK